MNKEQFAQWLEDRGACDGALVWGSDQTGSVEEIYNQCSDPLWLSWLYAKLDISTEYDKACDTTWAEYAKVRDLARAEYDKVCEPTRAEYVKVCDTAWAKYDKVRATAKYKWEIVQAALATTTE